MDNISEGLDFEFGSGGVDDLELSFPDIAPGANESRALARPGSPRFGEENEWSEGRRQLRLAMPRLTATKGVKDILGIAAGGAAGGFLIGGPIGATVGAVFGYLLV